MYHEICRSKKKSKKVKRADPKDLRHEDSTAVWNELAYFKNENRNLVVERYLLHFVSFTK
jgi:centlein